MKKTMLLGALLLSAVTVFAQESRQDISISAVGNFSPRVYGATGTYTVVNPSIGSLVSYRYLLTPRSGLEANYAYTQNTPVYTVPGTLQNQVHARQQEVSLAYVYSRTYKRYSPFIEGGPGVILFSPILDFQTNFLDEKGSTAPGGLFGAGLAYELSPSWDVRTEYRGFLANTPGFGIASFQVHRLRVTSGATLGFAYHF